MIIDLTQDDAAAFALPFESQDRPGGISSNMLSANNTMTFSPCANRSARARAWAIPPGVPGMRREAARGPTLGRCPTTARIPRRASAGDQHGFRDTSRDELRPWCWCPGTTPLLGAELGGGVLGCLAWRGGSEEKTSIFDEETNDAGHPGLGPVIRPPWFGGAGPLGLCATCSRDGEDD